MINEHSTSSFIFHVERIDQSTGQFFSYFQTVELSLYCISLKYTKILYVTIISKQKLAFRKHEDVPLNRYGTSLYWNVELLISEQNSIWPSEPTEKKILKFF